jgi:hypothetical protein
MLYTFKSPAAGNLIMLQPNGERILEIIGKDPGPKGIILPEQMPGAIAALENAMTREQPQAGPDKDAANGSQASDAVSLRQRAAPFVQMLKQCQAAGKEIVWGV